MFTTCFYGIVTVLLVTLSFLAGLNVVVLSIAATTGWLIHWVGVHLCIFLEGRIELSVYKVSMGTL